nr:hypothetical protein [Prevotella sp.]
MKRSFLIVVLLLSFVTAWSQQISREQSDLLFAEGVEKYRAGKYADALTCFEQVYAIDQQTCLETETRLYYGPMWMAACHFRLGNK